MRMKLTLPVAALATALLLAGCGKSDTPKTPEEAAKEAAATMEKPEPGKYKSSVKILEFDIPGLPKDQAEQMKGMMGGAGQSHEFCLTKADVDKGYEEMIKKSSQGNCKFEKFEASKNAIDAKMTCDMGNNSKSTMTMAGTTSSTSSKMTMDIDATNPQMPGGKMHTKMEVTNERIGDCAA